MLTSAQQYASHHLISMSGPGSLSNRLGPTQLTRALGANPHPEQALAYSAALHTFCSKMYLKQFQIYYWNYSQLTLN